MLELENPVAEGKRRRRKRKRMREEKKKKRRDIRSRANIGQGTAGQVCLHCGRRVHGTPASQIGGHPWARGNEVRTVWNKGLELVVR